MAVERVNQLNYSFVGLSGDSKPTTGVPAGARFLELDTAKVYAYDGVSAWSQISGAGATIGSVTGNVASGATDSGNPIKVGGVASTSQPSAASNGQRKDLWVTLDGALIMGGILVSDADGMTSGTGYIARSNTQAALAQAVRYWLFNESNWDRPRNNTQGTFQAQTNDSVATLTSSDITNYNGRSLRLIISFTDKKGTVDFTPKVQGKSKGGSYYDIWTAAAAVSAASVVVYDLNPFAVATANGVTESKICQIPRVFRVVLTYNGAGAGNSFDILGEYELGL